MNNYEGIIVISNLKYSIVGESAIKIILTLITIFEILQISIYSQYKQLDIIATDSWRQRDFVIGAFVGPEIINASDATARQYLQKVKDCSIDLIVYPYHVYDYHYPSGPMFKETFNSRSISLCKDVGLKYLVNDERHLAEAYWDEPTPITNFSAYVAGTMVNYYKGLSSTIRAAIYGYSLKDEPSMDHINSSHISYYRSYINFINQNHRTKLAYINLLPYYESALQVDKADYEDYIDDYVYSPVLNERPKAFGFDYYIAADYNSNGDLGSTNYFYNLGIIRDKARNRPFWVYPDIALHQGHINAGIDVDQAELRFQVFSSLAYGARGIIYYTYETRGNRTAMARNGVLTQKYYWVKELNEYIKNVVGPVIMSSHCIGTYHKNDFYNYNNIKIEVIENEYKINSNSIFLKNSSHSNSLVGVFHDGGDNTYLLIVNKGYRNNHDAITTTITLPGDLTNKIYTTSTIGPNWDYFSVSSYYSNGLTTFTVNNLLPGEGRLYKVVDSGLGEWDEVYSFMGDNTYHPAPGDYDGDGKDDISCKTDAGDWKIDYASNGFGLYDVSYPYYGSSDAHPVPADYDGDGITDLSVKTDWGTWYINFASDGFSDGWDVTYTGFGDNTNIPVPADYDGDNKADLSIKNHQGIWKIDYSGNGFGSIDQSLPNYGYADAHPVPADYDCDGKADLSIKADWGTWYINFASDGFSDGWDITYNGFGDASYIAIPADFDGDGKADLTVKNSSNIWEIDFSHNSYGSTDDINIYSVSGPSIPIYGDFDGNGQHDLSSKTAGYWYIDYNGYESNYLTKPKLNLHDVNDASILGVETDKLKILNYPNPFNPSTKFEVSVPYNTMVELYITDLLGRKITTLVSDRLDAGNYTYQFNAQGLSSGIYLYILKTNKEIETGKILLLK